MGGFAEAIARLQPGQGARVWSLIVTGFGDLAQGPGEELSGAALTGIFTEIGVRPEALRVALHRLRKEGWIETRREGRASFYSLAPLGRAQSQEAGARIYGPAPQMPGCWRILIAPEPGDAALERAVVEGGALPLGGRAALALGEAGAEPELISLSGADLALPDWARARLCPDALLADTAAFAALLAEVDWPEASEGSPAQIAALRLLVVHGWRRLVLRHPALPDAFLPEGSQMRPLRQRVHAVLASLPRPAPAALDQRP